MHIIAQKYLMTKQASQDITTQLALAHPTAYSMLGTPGMYGLYSNYTPEGQYLNAVAPEILSTAAYGGIGGLGASIALQGIKSLDFARAVPPALKATTVLGGAALGGLLGLGAGTAKYLGGKYLIPEQSR